MKLMIADSVSQTFANINSENDLYRFGRIGDRVWTEVAVRRSSTSAEPGQSYGTRSLPNEANPANRETFSNRSFQRIRDPSTPGDSASVLRELPKSSTNPSMTGRSSAWNQRIATVVTIPRFPGFGKNREFMRIQSFTAFGSIQELGKTETALPAKRLALTVSAIRAIDNGRTSPGLATGETRPSGVCRCA